MKGIDIREPLSQFQKIPLIIWPHQQRNLASRPSSSRIWPLKEWPRPPKRQKCGLATANIKKLLNLNILKMVSYHSTIFHVYKAPTLHLFGN